MTIELIGKMNKYFIMLVGSAGITTEVESSLEHGEYTKTLAEEYARNGYILSGNSKGAQFFIKDFAVLIVMTEKQYSDFQYEQQRQASLQRFNPNSRG